MTMETKTGEVITNGDCSLESITASAVPFLGIKRIIGIYFLLDGDSVVYVGQSENILARVTAHLYGRNRFNNYAYIRCELNELDKLESYYIAKFQPYLKNAAMPKGGDWQTLKVIARRLFHPEEIFKCVAKPRREADRARCAELLVRAQVPEMNGYFFFPAAVLAQSK